MEKRIELERRGHKACHITELNLDNCRSTSIVGLTDEYTALETLSLINVGLTTLKGFPKLPNLRKLELSDNRISNGLNYLHTSPKLQYLNLSGNKIKDLEALKPLEEFKYLTILDLFNNEATQIENYREKIFEMVPSLRFLDGFDCNEVEAPSEADDDEENGNFSEEENNQNVFSLNGIEIDLDELEEFESRVKAKREEKLKQKNEIVKQNTVAANSDVDELDEYLKELKLKELEKNATTETDNSSLSSDTRTTANFALLLYWFLAILNLASATFNNSSSSDDDEEFDSEGDDDDENDVSLSEVYNDDLELEEDSEGEWDEDDGAEDDDVYDDIDDIDDIDDDEVTAAKTDKGADGDENAEEPQARGKKRKHEG